MLGKVAIDATGTVIIELNPEKRKAEMADLFGLRKIGKKKKQKQSRILACFGGGLPVENDDPDWSSQDATEKQGRKMLPLEDARVRGFSLEEPRRGFGYEVDLQQEDARCWATQATMSWIRGTCSLSYTKLQCAMCNVLCALSSCGVGVTRLPIPCEHGSGIRHGTGIVPGIPSAVYP